MVTVETIGRVRHAFLVKGQGIKRISRELRLARNTVRGIVRGEATEHHYRRLDQPLPQLGAFAARLDAMLEENAGSSKRERLTFQRVFEALRLEGYAGGYDAVRRYGRAGWAHSSSISRCPDMSMSRSAIRISRAAPCPKSTLRVEGELETSTGNARVLPYRVHHSK